MGDVINIRVANLVGGGFASRTQVQAGTTIGDYVAENHGGAERFSVLVNRKDVTEDYVLQDGDFVFLSPSKVEAGMS